MFKQSTCFAHLHCLCLRIIVCGSGHQIHFVIRIVFSCSQEPLRVWNTITYFTDRQSFAESKTLIYHCENFSFCRKMVSSFSLIITLIADSKWSLTSWISVKCEDVLCAWEVREIQLFLLWHEGNKIKTRQQDDTEVTVKSDGVVTAVGGVHLQLWQLATSEWHSHCFLLHGSAWIFLSSSVSQKHTYILEA